MPLPTPKKDEKKSDFVQRCIIDEVVKKDFKDIKQRVAVCYSQFEQAKKKKESKASCDKCPDCGSENIEETDDGQMECTDCGKTWEMD